MTLRYGSVCSGIEAASVAWEPLGWKPAWFCEIDPFASALLAHRFPGVPNHGDFTRLLDPAHPVHADPVDVLVGGTPCQDFSVAGLRAGIEGDRGSLTLDFCRLVGVLRPRWVVWENVPGVLSSDGGRALGAFLGAMGELGYGFAWRVLDAQYFGLAQRRKRVFVVGCSGARRSRAASVLLEPESVRRDPPPSREAQKEAAPAAGGSAAEPGGTVAVAQREIAGTLDASSCKGAGSHGGNERDYIAHVVAPPLTATNDPSRSPQSSEVTAQVEAVIRTQTIARIVAPSAVLKSESRQVAVRRLTPRECERLQGFPDDYTMVPWKKKPASECPDGPRYKVLGNSMAVPVMRWIGARITRVDGIPNEPSEGGTHKE
jgi:DNA (cytosine-5)-methyltransferase 1